MKLEIRTKEKITVVDLDVLAARYAGIVNIGKKSNKVWNTIAIEGLFPVQSHRCCRLLEIEKRTEPQRVSQRADERQDGTM